MINSVPKHADMVKRTRLFVCQTRLTSIYAKRLVNQGIPGKPGYSKNKKPLNPPREICLVCP